jgi:rhamnose utilization protein RhaD (predicted bifunctional aldolase and dehydrogenase)
MTEPAHRSAVTGAPRTGAARLTELIELSRSLGAPARDLVILAEGNTSVRTGPGRMLVKASGSSMAVADEHDFVEVQTEALVALLDDPAAGDQAVTDLYAEVERETGRRPSVEAFLHAACLEVEEVDTVGHTHPVDVNTILCSRHAELIATTTLFPDQVVVLGPHALFVPYIDPGIVLARTFRQRLADHVERHGRAPRIAYLANHGIFALGRSPSEVERITQMAVKVGRVLTGSLAAGGVQSLSTADVSRIDSRSDEAFRRRVLDRDQPPADTGHTPPDPGASA